MRDTRSETIGYEDEEKLPEYEAEELANSEEDEEEGEYVKINVD